MCVFARFIVFAVLISSCLPCETLADNAGLDAIRHQAPSAFINAITGEKILVDDHVPAANGADDNAKPSGAEHSNVSPILAVLLKTQS